MPPVAPRHPADRGCTAEMRKRREVAVSITITSTAELGPTGEAGMMKEGERGKEKWKRARRSVTIELQVTEEREKERREWDGRREGDA